MLGQLLVTIATAAAATTTAGDEQYIYILQTKSHEKSKKMIVIFLIRLRFLENEQCARFRKRMRFRVVGNNS